MFTIWHREIKVGTLKTKWETTTLGILTYFNVKRKQVFTDRFKLSANMKHNQLLHSRTPTPSLL